MRSASSSSGGEQNLPIWKALVVMLVALEVIAIFVLPKLRETSTPTKSPSTSTTTDSQMTERHANEAGGYSFEYPSGWKLSDDGSLSKVTNGNGSAIVSFAPIPKKNAIGSLAQLVSSLRQSYQGFDLADKKVGDIGGDTALYVTGDAINSTGARIHLMAVTVAAEHGNYGITSFWTEAANPRQIELVKKASQSLRILPAS